MPSVVVAPLRVTKSPLTAPCDGAETVITPLPAEPVVRGFDPNAVVALIGVISLYPPPCSI